MSARSVLDDWLSHVDSAADILSDFSVLLSFLLASLLSSAHFACRALRKFDFDSVGYFFFKKAAKVQIKKAL